MGLFGDIGQAPHMARFLRTYKAWWNGNGNGYGNAKHPRLRYVKSDTTPTTWGTEYSLYAWLELHAYLALHCLLTWRSRSAELDRVLCTMIYERKCLSTVETLSG
jgi:hypothetical protein